MTRPVAILRPEPGNRSTAAAIIAAGGTALSLPLFRVTPLTWNLPDPAGYDGLLVTSANAIRHGGAGLAHLRALPVYAVGAASAEFANAAGFAVAQVGDRDAAALVAAVPPTVRLLHIAGRERVSLPGVKAVTVYAAEPILEFDPVLLTDTVAMLHSARAARRLAALIAPDRRNAIRIAAISPAVAAAAGVGWDRVASISRPLDAELVPLAIALAD